jgi:hypothetical protein
LLIVADAVSRNYPTQEELDAADGYLSRCKPYLARMQRERRRDVTRIDYMPGKEALAIIQARREREVRDHYCGHPRTSNGAVLDAIVTEWAELTGIK